MLNRALGVAVLSLCLLAAACGRESPERLLAEARAAIAGNELRTAEIHLKNLIQREPASAEGRRLLGGVLLARADYAGAEVQLRRALDYGAAAGSVQLPLLQALVGQRKFKDALQQIEHGPGLTGNERVAELILAGAAQRGLGARTEAERAYRDALAIDPESPFVRSDLAAVLIESGHAAEGRDLIDAILRDRPDFGPALLLRGGLEAGERQYASAEATLQKMLDGERAKRAESQVYQPGLAQLVEVQLAQGKLDQAGANADALLAAAPKSPVARYLKAAVQFQRNDLEAAERGLESLVVDAPEYWPAYRLLGAVADRQSRPGQALMYLGKAVSGDPGDRAARLQLAELEIRQGDLDAARQLLQQSLPSRLNEGVFLAFAARTSQQAGLQKQAAELFDQSEQQLPRDVRDLANVSTLYLAAGELDRAVRVLESSSYADSKSDQLMSYLLANAQAKASDLDGADRTASAAVARHPEAAWPLDLRGTIAMSRGDRAAAKTSFEKALGLEPKDADALLNLARIAAVENDRPRAEGYLKRIVAMDPHQTTALVGLAQLAALRGDFGAAQKWLEQAPESALRSRLEGELLARQGRYADAAAALAKAFDAAPSLGAALQTYAAASRAGLPSPDAELRTWMASHPDDPAGRLALGTIAMDRGQQAEAIEQYEAVLRAAPGQPVALNNLAWLYSERGDARALDYATRAYAANPDNPAIADTLGWLHVQQGEPAVGLPLLGKAAAAMPAEAEVGYHWAMALAATGDRDKALRELQRLLASGAQFAGRADAQRKAAELQAAAVN